MIMWAKFWNLTNWFLNVLIHIWWLEDIYKSPDNEFGVQWYVLVAISEITSDSSCLAIKYFHFVGWVIYGISLWDILSIINLLNNYFCFAVTNFRKFVKKCYDNL